MKPELYIDFKDLKNRGFRKEAATKLREFIDSFESDEDRKEWTKKFIESGDFGHRIRHEIYRELIFPVLFDGYDRKCLWSIMAFVKTVQSLYHQKDLWEKMDFHTEVSLLKLAHEISPDEQSVVDLLLEKDLEWFRFSMHEWPAGILYGNDGATMKQCDEILDEIEFARKLDSCGRHSALIDDFEAKVRSYKARLAQQVAAGNVR